jgi:ribosomal protein S18 acetylase RimI-like enzyme
MDPYTDAELDDMTARFTPQVRGLLESGAYLGYLVTFEQAVVAGAGLQRQVRLARPRMTATERGYIGNVWVDEAHRRRGLARWLMNTLLADCAARNIREVWLYASDMGRPLYVDLGFQRDETWVLRLPS